MLKYTVSLGVLFAMVFTQHAHAQNQLAGLLRDEYGLPLTPSVKSAGMGGADVGVYDIRSMNPAAIASSSAVEAAVTYANYNHDDAPNANRWRVDFSAPVPVLGGTARLLMDGIQSDGTDSTLLPGNAPINFNNDFFLGLQYGRELTDWLALGVAGYPYDKAEVEMQTPGGKVKGEALSQIGSIHTGIVATPHEKVSLGLSYIYIKDELKAHLPDGSSLKDDFDVNYFAVGLSVLPFEGTLLAADFWKGDIDGKVNPETDFGVSINRWKFGLEQKICSGFDARIGSNNSGLTLGFTVHLGEQFDLDYAFSNKALRDKEGAFGDTRYHAVSLHARF